MPSNGLVTRSTSARIRLRLVLIIIAPFNPRSIHHLMPIPATSKRPMHPWLLHDYLYPFVTVHDEHGCIPDN